VRGDRVELAQRAVRRAVVDGDDLELVRRVVEREQRAQRLGDRRLLVERGHHDRDVRLDPGRLPGR
jgi:hypothetical protein